MLQYVKKTVVSIDYLVLFIISALAIFGIIVIGSVTNIHIDPNSSLQGQQQLSFLTGLLLFFLFAFIDYKFIARFYRVIYGVSLILLFLTLTPLAVQTQAGVARGLNLYFLTIQPSQFSKIFMIIFLASFVDRAKNKINDFPTLLRLAILLIIPIYLIFQQPSLSASMAVLLISLTIIFLGGISYKYIFTVFSAVIPLLILATLDIMRGPGNYIMIDRLIGNFQIQRLEIFLSDDIHMQNERALEALGSGQMTGRGLNNGIINQLNRLPEAHNDFIFAVIGEEFGFIGANLVLLAIFILIIKCFIIAHNADTNVGRLIASGVGAMLFYQTFIHVGVVTNILPNTGITLPFVSYGGSSMWTLMISLGIVMNIHINKKPESIFADNYSDSS